MTEAIDPVTSALTGHLSFHLLLAALLTWPVSLGLLRLYTRAVRRSMRSRAHGTQPADAERPPATIADAEPGTHAERRAATLHDLPEASLTPAADALLARLITRPRRAGFVYAMAGVAYALVMVSAQLMAGGLAFRPIRFLFLFWNFVWPIVPTIAIVAATTRRVKIGLVALYFLGLTIIGAIEMPISPDLTWPQVFMVWLMYDLPGTILLVMYLSRRIRAVGPLVLTFILLALIGSDVVVSVAGSQVSYQRAMIKLTSAVGIGGTGTFVALLIVGFLIFAVIGWAAITWIRHQYQAKQISDESMTVDATWMLFAVVHSTGLAFEHPLWTLAGPAAFAVYKVCARVGFSRLARRDVLPQKSPVLLVLRSFSIGSNSEKLFDVVGRHWRRVGSIEMIAGIDLVSRTVEPHEFLDFVSGRLSRRFIDGQESLDRRMSERDVAAVRDLRFRVNEFFCYDDTWKMTLSRLVHESDAVLMDLRGFSRQNAGCVFELHELSRLVPLDRVVFVADRRTDETLLAESLGDGRAGVIRLGSMTGTEMRQLMRALAAAATLTSTVDVCSGVNR
jgi:MFS family permease